MFILPLTMVGWFILIQVKRGFALSDLDEIGMFMSVYLFAFPLASLLQDGDKKKALKVFAGAYIAAAVLLSLHSMLLILGCMPYPLADKVYWDGARLRAIWHPNIVACFLMVGIVFCTTFLAQVRSWWSKTVYSVLLVLMITMLSLTSCRTVIVMTGGYLSSLLFFRLIRRSRKWFLPGVISVAFLTVVFYWGAMQIYQTNSDMLVEKYTQRYSNETVSDTPTVSPSEAETTVIEMTEVTEASNSDETVAPGDTAEGLADSQETQNPIEVDPETGKVELITRSSQGTFINDLATLNNRSKIWAAAIRAIRETPSILCWGEQLPGEYVSQFSSLTFPHLHNAWMECLVAMGLVGALLAVLFTLHTVWNCVFILIKYHQDLWKRNVAILTLCLMAASLMEPYLFYTTLDYHVTNFLFFLCAGYLLHWQAADDRCIWDRIRNRISPPKS